MASFAAAHARYASALFLSPSSLTTASFVTPIVTSLPRISDPALRIARGGSTGRRRWMRVASPIINATTSSLMSHEVPAPTTTRANSSTILSEVV
jgi:hypothetical protein